jgi:hypothetical protein
MPSGRRELARTAVSVAGAETVHPLGEPLERTGRPPRCAGPRVDDANAAGSGARRDQILL